MSSPAASSTLPAGAAAGGGPSAASRALTVGLVGVAIGLVGVFMGISQHNPRPLVGWLFGFAFWFSMSLGMLYLVMLFYLFDAGWPIVIRRQLEHAIGSFRVLAICFIPLLLVALGLFGHEAQGLLWPWLNPEQPLPGGHGTIAADPLYQWKEGYLNLPFFLIRLAIYCLVFVGLARIFRNRSFGMDTDPQAWRVVSCRKWAAFGVFAVSLSATFAAFDFFMSRSYQWFSTMYGVWFFATSMRAGLAGTVILCFLLSREQGRPLFGLYNRAHQYLLGCLCLAFTVFWAYITFCQYFLIYNADIPEETFWFNLRELNVDWMHNSWWWVGLGLIFGYFFLPFFALLSYYNKVRRTSLVYICCWILCFHILDLYFNILPSKVPAEVTPENTLGYTIIEFVPSVWDFASLIGIGGLVVWAFLKSQARAEPIPVHDPRIEESLHYHE